MISRYDVTMNGISLSSISGKILILNVQHPAPTYSYETIGSLKRNGSRIQREYKESQDCIIEFAIREYDIRRRQEICQAVCSWAKSGGVLQTNDRPGQMLQCVCSALPSISSVRDWTKPLSITFTAYVIPFWQEVLPSTLTLTGTDENGILYLPGNGGLVEVSATILINATFNGVTIRGADGSWIAIQGDQDHPVPVAVGDTITISYDAENIMSIKNGTTLLMPFRAGTDDVNAKSGEYNIMSIAAGASVTVTMTARGRWE